MKKLILILTALMLLISLSACGDKPSAPVGGGSSQSGSPTDIEIPEATPEADPQPVTELSVCGIPVVTDGRLSGIGYQGATYNEGVLTLENVDLLPEQGNYPIYFTGDLEIVLKGDNKITASSANDIEAGIYAADLTAEDGTVTSSNLIISGDGSLTVSATGGVTESDGIWCAGKVAITATGAISITAETHAVHDKAQLVTDGLNVAEKTDTTLVIG